jgi:hypothetical protein
MAGQNLFISWVRSLSILLSIALFIVSLTQQCYCTSVTCADAAAVLLIGWIGAFYGGAALSWLANPLLITSWILTKNNSKYGLWTSLAATLFAALFLIFDDVIDNEAGHFNPIVAYLPGYWLWLASAAVLFIGNLLLRIKPK